MSNYQIENEMELYGGVKSLLNSPTHDSIGDVVKAIFMDNIDNYRQHFYSIKATAVSIDHTFKASVTCKLESNKNEIPYEFCGNQFRGSQNSLKLA